MSAHFIYNSCAEWINRTVAIISLSPGFANEFTTSCNIFTTCKFGLENPDLLNYSIPYDR